jgi:excisionase family DNA binding protein
MADEWMGPEALAEELGIPLRTIYAWRSAGKGPRGHKLGKHVRFRRADVEEWLAAQAEAR